MTDTIGYAAIPLNFTWTLNQTPLPKVIDEALKLYGVKEKAGPANNPVIMQWADEVGQAAIGYKYAGDSVPWCGLTAAIVCQRAGKKIPAGPLYALNWSKFGTAVAMRQGLSVDQALMFVPGKAASFGDVLVFRREGGGHVGFYIGEDENYYAVLGGNQGDAVSFTWIAKARCVAIRRPEYQSQPATVVPHRLKRTGAISENEA